MQVEVVTALVAAAASLAVAGASFASTRANGRELERLRQTNSVELEQIKSDLESARANVSARLSYEYEARKRLYEKVEPLIFQLTIAAESAYVRITELARTARQGNLEESHTWLNDPANDYFLISTMHRLIAPLSIIRIWERNLTLVDLSLDLALQRRFATSRMLQLTWSSDFMLAAAEPAIPYDRNPPQGLYIGDVERLADALIVADGDARRVMSFGEFEAAVHSGSPLAFAVAPMADVLRPFHPARRPVTWRILVGQAHLLRLLTIEDAPDEASFGLPLDQRADFDWSGGDETAVVAAPFTAARAWLWPQLRHTLQAFSR